MSTSITPSVISKSFSEAPPPCNQRQRRSKYSVALALPSSCQRGESVGIDMDWARVAELRQMTATLKRNTLPLGLCRIGQHLALLISVEMMESEIILNALAATVSGR